MGTTNRQSRAMAYTWPPPAADRDQWRRRVTSELQRLGFHVWNGQPTEDASAGSVLPGVVPEGSLVLIDISDAGPEVFAALGEARAVQQKVSPSLMICLIGSEGSVGAARSFGFPFAPYDLDDEKSIRGAVTVAATYAREMAPPRPRPREIEAILDAVPMSVSTRLPDPVLALAVTLYILHIGKIVGEEIVATIGFPPFPADEHVIPRVRDLFPGEPGRESAGLRPDRALAFVHELERRLDLEAAGRSQSPVLLDRHEDGSLLAAAVLHRGQRDARQSAALLEFLSAVEESSEDEGEHLAFWHVGLVAISRIARLVVSLALPGDVGTMDNLRRGNTSLQAVSTLGGALFLRPSIEVLALDDGRPPSPYAPLGIRLAELTQGWGERPQKPEAAASQEQADYIDGLKRFAQRDGTVFTLEHPFHFRVLLEVLSGENRRYPAEPVLNVQALRRVWPERTFWHHFAWSRDQLPVVANELRHGPRSVAFVQHYAAFGRTPLTSSFSRLSYETVSPLKGRESPPWPRAFEHNRKAPIHNEPNTVLELHRATRRQQSLGRLWRGDPLEQDLRWMASQLVLWDGEPEPDGVLADRVWDSAVWLGRGFAVDVLAEIRTAAWLLESFRLRLARSSLPAGWEDGPVRDDVEKEAKEVLELRCVSDIMTLFVREYAEAEGDGVPGIVEDGGVSRRPNRGSRSWATPWT